MNALANPKNIFSQVSQMSQAKWDLTERAWRCQVLEKNSCDNFSRLKIPIVIQFITTLSVEGLIRES